MGFRDTCERSRSSRQFAGLQGEPGDEGDVLAVAVVEHLLPFTVGEVVAVLHGDDVEEPACPFDLLDCDFRETGVTDFPFALEVADRSELILFRYLRVDAMQLPEIDAI